jgi:hypothetical protein
MRKNIKTVEDFVRAFDEFLDEDDPLTPEEIDTALREAGHDPEEVGVKMQAVAEHALAESPWNWRNRARKELEDERARIARRTTSVPRNKASLIEAIEKLVVQSGGQMAYAYRNLESETEENLVSLLADLEYLIAHQASRDEE